MAAIPDLPPNPAKYCSHKVAIANLAKVMSSPGYHPGQFRHVHDPSQPGKKSGKKKSRKKRPYSGILTQQMIESRENERQRINEVNMNLNYYGKLLKLKKLGKGGFFSESAIRFSNLQISKSPKSKYSKKLS